MAPSAPSANDCDANKRIALIVVTVLYLQEHGVSSSLKYHNARVMADIRCVVDGRLHWRSLSAETVSDNRCDTILIMSWAAARFFPSVGKLNGPETEVSQRMIMMKFKLT